MVLTDNECGCACHGGNGGSRGDTTEVTLRFLRGELLYDAANYSYVSADIMKEDDVHVRHQVFDIIQEGNVDRVTRVLDTAHAECIEMLYRYTKLGIPEGGGEMDDKLREHEVYEIRLSLPGGISLTTVHLLEHLVHEYLVCRVVADWMSLTNPDMEEVWEKKFTAIRDKVKSLLSRSGITRRKMKPF